MSLCRLFFVLVLLTNFTLSSEARADIYQDSTILWNYSYHCLEGTGETIVRDIPKATVKLVQKLAWSIVNPFETIDILWEVAEWSDSSILQAPQLLYHLLSELSRLDIELQAKITCKIITSVGLGALFAYFSAGIASSAFYQSLSVTLWEAATVLEATSVAGMELVHLSHLYAQLASLDAQAAAALSTLPIKEIDKTLKDWKKVEKIEKIKHEVIDTKQQ